MVQVSVQTVSSRKLAAVSRQVFIPQIATAWKPALDQVLGFLKDNPGLRTDGHNVFLYRHPQNMDQPMTVNFGVEVTRAFDACGDVHDVDTPSGEAAVALHVGAYQGLPQTHAALHAWMKANGRTSNGWSMEIYGDWSSDPARLETTVIYLLQL